MWPWVRTPQRPGRQARVSPGAELCMHPRPALLSPESLWAADQKGLWSPEAGGAPACLQHRSMRYAKGRSPLQTRKRRPRERRRSVPGHRARKWPSDRHSGLACRPGPFPLRSCPRGPPATARCVGPPPPPLPVLPSPRNTPRSNRQRLPAARR